MGSTAFIVGIVFVITGIVFLVVALIFRGKVQKAQSWPVISGTVESTEIKEHNTRTKVGNNYRTSTTYEPVVKYTYSVSGQTYTGKRIAYSGFQGTLQTAQDKLSQYAQGSTVQVHYNPKKPGDAVLELNLAAGKVYWVFTGIFLVVGVVGILWGVLAG